MPLSPEKIDALRNPTEDKALKFWRSELLGSPQPDVALAGLHKARCMWPQSTAKMVRDSRAWLSAHGFDVPPRLRQK